MSEETYLQALELHEYVGDACIALSGGEPTLHPKFKRFLILAASTAQAIGDGITPWLATNGSKETISMWLLNNTLYPDHDEILNYAEEQDIPLVYSEEGYFSVELSQDKWHDKTIVSPAVTKAYNKPRVGTHQRFIRDVSGKEIQAGHYVGASKDIDDCCCSSLQIKPNGDVFLCGCSHSPRIGTVEEHDKIHGILHLLSWLNIDACVKQVDQYDFSDREAIEDGIVITSSEAIDMVCNWRNLDKYTVREWVAEHMPVKAKYVGHPETYRISLERQTELSEYKA